MKCQQRTAAPCGGVALDAAVRLLRRCGAEWRESNSRSTRTGAGAVPFQVGLVMSEAPTAGQADALQFDRAELPTSGGLACRACKTPIGGDYFTANGVVICPRCKAAIERDRRSVFTPARFLKASVFGTGAAIAGAVLWSVVRTVWRYEGALVAIAVGFLIGRAVRAGSDNRGGWPFQVVALILTYVCIALSLLPEIQRALSTHDATVDSGAVTYWFVMAYMLVRAPIAVAFSSLIGALIYGFAFYEAWKLTRQAPVNYVGPLRTTVSPPILPTAPAPEVAAGG